jgi:hypothetical protein
MSGFHVPAGGLAPAGVPINLHLPSARGINAQLAVVDQRPEGTDQQLDLARGLLGHRRNA